MSDPKKTPPTLKPGGTEGGETLFLAGGGLSLLGFGLYFLLDSVRVVTGDFGALSGMMSRNGGMAATTSMGVIFVPFIIGAAVLFYDAAMKWAWGLAGFGLFAIIIEILSRVRFVLNMKTTHLLLIFIMVAAGAGLLARAYRTNRANERK